MHGDQPDKSNLSISTPLSPPVDDPSWIPERHEAEATTDEHLDASRVVADPASLRSSIEALARERADLDQRRTVIDDKIMTLEGALKILENLA
jgi:hypothetical protein